MGILLTQFLLDGVPSFCFLNCIAQLGAICKPAEDALDPTVCVIEEDIEEHQSEDRTLRDTTHHLPPSGQRGLDHNCLNACIHPISYLNRLNNLSLFVTVLKALKKSTWMTLADLPFSLDHKRPPA